MLTATELARALDLSKGRISQLVSEGKLDGCFSGEGRARRFDELASAEALGRRLDPGQRMGNGAAAQRAAARILSGDRDMPPAVALPSPGASAEPAPASDYELARTEKVREDARRARRINAEAEGRYVLADEVERQVRRQIGQEVAEVQAFIRDAARLVSDRLEVDFKMVRQIMSDQWRLHREGRSAAAERTAATAPLSQAEEAENI